MLHASRGGESSHVPPMRHGRSRPAPRGTALAACALAVFLLAPAALGAAPRHPGRGLRVAVLSCVTGSVRVATRLGCPTTPGVGGPFESSGLERVTALAASGSRTSLYALSNDNSSLTQLSLGPSRALSFAACGPERA